MSNTCYFSSVKVHLHDILTELVNHLTICPSKEHFVELHIRTTHFDKSGAIGDWLPWYILTLPKCQEHDSFCKKWQVTLKWASRSKRHQIVEMSCYTHTCTNTASLHNPFVPRPEAIAQQYMSVDYWLSMHICSLLIYSYGQPDEIASVIAFLLSNDASYMAGQSVIASGGFICTRAMWLRHHKYSRWGSWGGGRKEREGM